MTDLEQLRAEFRAGLEGVTPGPWEAQQSRSMKYMDGVVFRYVKDACASVAVVGSKYAHVGTSDLDNQNANSAHIARCSPENIAALLDALDTLQSRLEEAEAERDEARALVIEANNSLYGSQGYFHSLNGGPFDKYHLATGIENLKDAARRLHLTLARAEAAEAKLAEREAVLRRNFCPRPGNNRPDDFEVGQCIDAGECGCINSVASTISTKGDGQFAADRQMLFEAASDPSLSDGAVRSLCLARSGAIDAETRAWAETELSTKGDA